MSTTGQVREELEAGVLTVVLNRPEKKNALTRAMYARLAEVFERAQNEAAVRVMVIRGAGGVFTAGNDLKDFMQEPPRGEESPVFRWLRQLAHFAKPLVMAVEGPAIGVGTTMLLHADLVYAAHGSRFHLPFVNLGLVPEGGSSFLLPRLVGLQKANELLMLGEPFGPEDARALGLVSEVHEPGALYTRVHDRARALARQPAGALREAKRLIRSTTEDSVHEALRREAIVFAERLSSPEAMEAFQAFFEKRKPDFSQFS